MKKLFIWAACGAAILSSCSNEIVETMDSPTVQEMTSVDITTYVGSHTRIQSTDITSQNIQNVYVNGYTQDDGAYVTLGDGTYTYTKTENAWTIVLPENGNAFLWPINNTTEVTFLARTHNGPQSLVMNDIEISSDMARWKMDTSTGDIDYMASGKVVATEKENGSSVNFDLSHLLGKVEINLVAPENDAIEVTAMKLNIPSYCTYDFFSGEVETGESIASIDIMPKENPTKFNVTDESTNYATLLSPGGECYFSISYTNKYTGVTYDKYAFLNVTTNVRNVFTVSLSLERSEIKIGKITVNDWSDSAETDVELQ